MNYRKRKCLRGPAIDRGDRRLYASPREHSVAIGGKPNWVIVVAGKIVPRKFLSYVSFAGTSRSTVIKFFQSVCTDTSDESDPPATPASKKKRGRPSSAKKATTPKSRGGRLPWCSSNTDNETQGRGVLATLKKN